MYVFIRDFYAKLLLENIDNKFQEHNEKLLMNIKNIQKRNQLLSESEISELIEEMNILKTQVHEFKKQIIYLNTLLNDISSHCKTDGN